MFTVYKGHLRTLLDKGFTEEAIQKDLTAINAAIDPLKQKEKEAVAARREDRGRGGPGFGGPFNRTPDLAKFVAKRAESIAGQLDGERKGKVLSGRFGPGGRGFGPGSFLAKPILEAADALVAELNGIEGVQGVELKGG